MADWQEPVPPSGGTIGTYRTSQLAELVGVHPNTVRLYERLGFISPPERQPNGYRVFTDRHLEQMLLARAALRTEILQANLRRLAYSIIAAVGADNLDEAEELTEQYAAGVAAEQQRAEEALAIVRQWLAHEPGGLAPATQTLDESSRLARESAEPTGMDEHHLTRQQTADHLGVTIDTLRNWELNNLLTVKRKHNGYRVYIDEDIQRLKVIRTLRLAHFSLSAVLRQMNQLDRDATVDLAHTIDQPKPDDDIISVCDRLLTSLEQARRNAEEVSARIERLRELA